jgi:hypothetical protein
MGLNWLKYQFTPPQAKATKLGKPKDLISPNPAE